MKEWEALYGEFDKNNYEAYTIQNLPSESSFYHGEIIKWARDIKPQPRRTLLAGEGNIAAEHLQEPLGIENILTTGMLRVDVPWNFEEAPPDIGAFDLIISQAILEHLINPYKHMCDLASLLEPAGHLIVHSVCPGFQYHRFPVDTFRFFPDWFEEVGKRIGLCVGKKRIKGFHIFYMYQKPEESAFRRR